MTEYIIVECKARWKVRVLCLPLVLSLNSCSQVSSNPSRSEMVNHLLLSPNFCHFQNCPPSKSSAPPVGASTTIQTPIASLCNFPHHNLQIRGVSSDSFPTTPSLTSGLRGLWPRNYVRPVPFILSVWSHERIRAVKFFFLLVAMTTLQ